MTRAEQSNEDIAREARHSRDYSLDRRRKTKRTTQVAKTIRGTASAAGRKAVPKGSKRAQALGTVAVLGTLGVVGGIERSGDTEPATAHGSKIEKISQLSHLSPESLRDHQEVTLYSLPSGDGSNGVKANELEPFTATYDQENNVFLVDTPSTELQHADFIALVDGPSEIQTLGASYDGEKLTLSGVTFEAPNPVDYQAAPEVTYTDVQGTPDQPIDEGETVTIETPGPSGGIDIPSEDETDTPDTASGGTVAPSN